MTKQQNAFALRKAPVQKRSRQTFQWLLEAAIQIFEEKEYDLVTTNEIAERAGVSVGSLYQYFPNKESVLLQLFKQHSEGIFGALEEVLSDASVKMMRAEHVVQAVLDLMDEHHHEHPTVHRMFWSMQPLSEELLAFKQACRNELRTLIAEVIRVHPSFYAPDPSLSAWMLIHLVSALVHEHNLQPDAPPKEQMYRELQVIILDYLSPDKARHSLPLHEQSPAQET